MSDAASRFSRRRFLGAVGLGAIATSAIPYVPLVSSDALAGEGFPKRLLLLLNGNGTIQESFWPGGGLDLDGSPILRELATYRDRMTVVRGVYHKLFEKGPGRDHVKASMQVLTARPLLGDGEGSSAWPGESVDHFIARRIEERASTTGERRTPFRTICAAIGDNGASFSGRGEGDRISDRGDPRVLFDELFEGIPVGAGDTGDTGDTGVRQRLAERRVVFDAVAQRLGAIEDRVGRDGRAKIESHLASLERVRASLEGLAEAPSTCGRPSLDTAGLGSVAASENYERVCDLQFQILRSAFACDLARVAKLSFSSGERTPSWIGSLPSLRDPTREDTVSLPATIHNIAHHGFLGRYGDAYRESARSAGRSLEIWRARQIKNLLDYLDAVPEGSGTLLDNTLVVWTSDMARGDHRITDPAPVVIFGGGGGALSTGRLVDAGDAAFSHLLASLCRLMDVDVTSFGDPEFAGYIDALG